MNFEINLSFLIKPFSSMIKKVRIKIEISQEQKSFLDEIKSIFHHFEIETNTIISFESGFRLIFTISNF